MPATPDKIPDKTPFDVYAMLIILTFLFTGGATLMINDRLSKDPSARGAIVAQPDITITDRATLFIASIRAIWWVLPPGIMLFI